ncbi:MAG: hypothetical protein HQL01_06715 [Nitrospirae bacterium]|nr:hypothetical protein [Nitrospirota bacterium]
MKALKYLMAVSILMVAVNLYAAEGDSGHNKIDPERLEKIKARVVEAIEHKIGILQKEKVCMQAVQTRDDYKKCRTETKKAWAEYIEHREKK